MRRTSTVALRLVMSTFPAILLCGLQAQTAKKLSVLDGVYSEAQAARGALAYTKTCAECHDLSFDGTPIDGEGFIDNWREFPLETLYDFISTNMPEDSPGTLSKDSYRDILAYILHRNSYPVGRGDLTDEVIKTTAMVGPDGPKPLASDTMVKVTGCVTPGPENSWELTEGSDPIRIRKPDPATAEELQSARAIAPGVQKFKLLNLDNLDPKFLPDDVKGKKVLIKGVFVKDSYGARLSAMTLQKLGANCIQ